MQQKYQRQVAKNHSQLQSAVTRVRSLATEKIFSSKEKRGRTEEKEEY